MNVKLSTIPNLPKIEPVDYKSFSSPFAFIGSIGFENRSLAFMKDLRERSVQLTASMGIEYTPALRRNRVREFKSLIDSLNMNRASRYYVTYDRFNPQRIGQESRAQLAALKRSQRIAVDISGMSKFLIAVLLQELRDYENELFIVYTEAGVYYPTKADFEERRNKAKDTSPDFLTSDVFSVVTTPSLSSVSMQGYPIILITFPSFNHYDMMSLLNEVSPQKLVLLEGVPHLGVDKWRIDAIRWINRKVRDYIEPTCFSVSTFEYAETIDCLEVLYRRYHEDHRIVIGPTGSKMQALAVFLFAQMHPDVQLVYPVTKTFAMQYTRRHRNSWQIRFVRFSSLVDQLAAYRKGEILSLIKNIDYLSREVPE